MIKNTFLLKAADVAEVLRISRSTAFRLMQSGAIPTVRFGRLVRVREEDLETFINSSVMTENSTKSGNVFGFSQK